MSRSGRKNGGEVWRERIEGGYRRISVVQLCMSWSLYTRGTITRRDLRVWFACHELQERRCMVERGGKMRFTAEEIRTVTGGLPVADVRASLKSLAHALLLDARKSRMRFAKSITELGPDDAEAAQRMLECITNRRRVIRVPRRLVRSLAEGRSKAVMATVYAHLLRCVYFQAGKGRYRVDGRCKASWIAETFGISERAVVTARRKLIECGWLVVMESPQWQLNRYGLRLAVDLDWSCRPVAKQEESSPPTVESVGRTSGPRANSTLLQKNTTLARRAGIGVRKRTKGGRRRWPGRFDVCDLVEPERFERLCERLVGVGAISDSEADRERVAGAAARALRKGTSNPCGLFYAVVRDALWAHVSQEDESEGNALRGAIQRRSTSPAQLASVIDRVAAGMSVVRMQRARTCVAAQLSDESAV